LKAHEIFFRDGLQNPTQIHISLGANVNWHPNESNIIIIYH
jgi:hypothetical protein